MRNWWLTRILEDGGWGMVVAWSFWVIASVVLHELAHGIAAIRCGDRTPIETGHMTWNPVVHMGTSGVIMFALLGVTWGAMPVNPSRFKGRYDYAKVAFAGPLVNLWIAAFAVAAAAVMVVLSRRGVVDILSPGWPQNLAEFFYLGARLNLVLVMLNMLPIPPLDGSRILGNFWRGYREMVDRPEAAGASLFALLAIFLFGGRYLFPAAESAASFLIFRLAGLVG